MHLYLLQKHIGCTDEQIAKMPVRKGLQSLENWYDEKMETEVRELSMHGYNVKDVSQCGVQYKLWMNRKKGEAQPRQELTMAPEDIEKMNARMNKAIFKAVGKKIIDQKVLK